MSKKNTLNGESLREYKKTITLNQMQRALSTAKRGPQPPRPLGTLLGDDCAGTQASACISLDRGQPRFCAHFIQTITRAEYIQHLYDITRYFVSTPSYIIVGVK